MWLLSIYRPAVSNRKVTLREAPRAKPRGRAEAGSRERNRATPRIKPLGLRAHSTGEHGRNTARYFRIESWKSRIQGLRRRQHFHFAKLFEDLVKHRFAVDAVVESDLPNLVMELPPLSRRPYRLSQLLV
jgi:hypothetical protein